MIKLTLIVVASIALVVILAVVWLLVLRPWLDGIRYARSSAHHRNADPVYGDTAEHDAAFAEALREAREEHLVPAAEPCGDPGCSQMTHDGTGQMAALDEEALSLMADLAAGGQTRRAENLRLMHAPGTPSFYPYAATQTVHLPPWEEENDDERANRVVVPDVPRRPAHALYHADQQSHNQDSQAPAEHSRLHWPGRGWQAAVPDVLGLEVPGDSLLPGSSAAGPCSERRDSTDESGSDGTSDGRGAARVLRARRLGDVASASAQRSGSGERQAAAGAHGRLTSLAAVMDAGYGPGDEVFDRAFWGDHYGDPGEPGDPASLPGPYAPGDEARTSFPEARAGEFTRRIRAAWTILTGRPQNLPGPGRSAAAPGFSARAGEPNLTGQDGRESDTGVLTGEVVQPPAAAPVVVNIVAITVTDPAPDPWLEAKVAAVRAQIDADAAAAQRELRAWSDSLLAITAGAS